MEAMWNQRLQTNRLWWLAASSVLFLIGTYVELLPTSKYGGTTWLYWKVLLMTLAGDYHCSTVDAVVPLVLWTAMLAIPSAVLGWVAQAMCVALTGAMTRQLNDRPPQITTDA
jgi:hypothetical protein